MKEIICYIKALPLFIKSDVWCPHVYEEVSRSNAIIISTENGFRVSKNLLHANGEIVHPKATLIKNKCIYCGKEHLSWYDKEPYIIGDIHE